MSVDEAAIQRVSDATDFLPIAAAFALGHTGGDDAEAIAFLWSIADDAGPAEGAST